MRLAFHPALKFVRTCATKVMSAEEKRLADILRRHFPNASKIDVEDTSGGCGSFYRIFVESGDFKGKPVLNQHKMINQALADEVKKFHGLHIQTSAPKA